MKATDLMDEPLLPLAALLGLLSPGREVVAYIIRAFAHSEEKEEGAVESDVALDCFQIGSSRSGH